MRFILFLTICVSFQLTTLAQTEKTINTDNQLWASFFHQARLTNKFGLYLDGSYRRSEEFIKEPFQLVIRPGIIYYISEKARLMGGYAYFSHYPGRTKRQVTQPEHRAWQQFQWNQKYQGFSTRQYFRLEQRFRRKFKNDNELSDDYHFNYRMRYNFAITLPLKGTEGEAGACFLTFTEEVMVNFGKEIVYNYFDQNRASLMLGYQLSKSSNLLLGYMHLFQQTTAGNVYNSNNAIRITFNQNLDFRNQE